ncbi:MAG TPA: argininosuccinate lyase [Candidatus Goldiibacteriota bacterium]|nr:argininosuccinate lyase [Candidatus Goldiibacteriota bacterium]
MKKVWRGRFKKEIDAEVNNFNASISFDKRLFRYDVMAGQAYAKALYKIRILKSDEMKKIINGLEKLLEKENTIDFKQYEDVHSAVEIELVKLIGDTGKKLHTGRSRNDLISTDTRMYLKDEIVNVKKLLKDLMQTIVNMADLYKDTYMPGYTHMQHAQIIAVGHWLLSYFTMLKRDYNFLGCIYERMNLLPLGSGALAGSNYNVHRMTMARILGFKDITENSIDAVSDRDFVMDFLYASSLIAAHLSRLAEEIVLFNSNEFSFIEIDDSFATGSSLMPNKKNPDVAELIRGKTGGFYGRLMAGLTILKGLPLAYNKDMQEDKPLLFESIDQIKTIIKIIEKFLRNVKMDEDKMSEQLLDYFMYSTDIADYLVRKGMTFRDAYELVGKLVAYCIENKKSFGRLGIDELQDFSELFDEDVFELLHPEASADSKLTPGSTSYKYVCKQIKAAKSFLNFAK